MSNLGTMTANAFSITDILTGKIRNESLNSGQHKDMANLKNKLSPDKVFYIPSYQRRYSWRSESEIEKLLKDLRTFWNLSKDNDKKSYFLGNVIIKRNEQDTNQEYERYTVIDGQQRLTTFYIIVSALYKIGIEKTDGIDYSEQLEKLKAMIKVGNNKSLLKFDAKENNDSLSSIDYNATEGHEFISDGSNYHKNYLWLKNKLGDDKVEFKDWCSLIERIKLSLILLGDDDDAVAVFESINTGGLVLNIADLVKAYFFLVAERYELEDDVYDQIIKVYNKLAKVFELDKKEKSSKTNKEWDLNSLSYFIISAIQLIENKPDFIKKDRDVIYDRFKKMVELKMASNIDKRKALLSTLISFEKYIDEYCKLLVIKNNFSKNSIKEDISRHHVISTRLEGYLTMLLSIEIENHSDKNRVYELLDFHLINTAVANGKPAGQNNKFFISYLKRNNGKIRYNTLLDFLLEGNASDHLKSKEDFFYQLKRIDFYSKSGFRNLAKYLFYRIESKLNEKAISDYKVIWGDEWSIEHLMPQDNSKWNKDSFDEVYFRDNIHTLQNLILMKVNVNSSVGNKPWNKKVNIYKSSSYKIVAKLLERIEGHDWALINSDINQPNTKWFNWIQEKLTKIFDFEILPGKIQNDDLVLKYLKSVDEIKLKEWVEMAYLWNGNASMSPQKVSSIITRLKNKLRADVSTMYSEILWDDSIKVDNASVRSHLYSSSRNKNFYNKNEDGTYDIKEDKYIKFKDGL